MVGGAIAHATGGGWAVSLKQFEARHFTAFHCLFTASSLPFH